MQLNAEDDGNRKFILVQWAEKLDDTPTRKKSNQQAIEFLDEIGKPRNIFEICAERIRRAGAKLDKGDIGFKVFDIIADEQAHIYNRPITELSQTELPDFKQGDIDAILYSLMVADKIRLDAPVESIIARKLYHVDDGNIYIFDAVTIDDLRAIDHIERITIYSPSFAKTKFTLEFEAIASQLNIASDKWCIKG